MSELRLDPIKKHWVILAGERAQRPSEFSITVETRSSDECPFCPGHENETPNPILTLSDAAKDGWAARLIPNKFPAVDQIEEELLPVPLPHEVRRGQGRHEVMIESPLHDDRQSRYSTSHLASILGIYQSRIGEFINSFSCRHVTIFTNVGYRAGATLSHPHSQIIGLRQVPGVIERELESAVQHYKMGGSCLFCDLLKADLESGARVIYSTDDFIALCPYASRFAYEFAIYPRRHMADFRDVKAEEMQSFAGFLKACLGAMDVCLNDPDYNVILHSAPAVSDQANLIEAAYHWHLEVIPRVSTQAGMEWGTGIHINSFPPEKVAQSYSRELLKENTIAL
ncbi:DUF4931 domain-containing protein [bacterium]|nr:DUF4931 domain-containing protein [bacterium]